MVACFPLSPLIRISLVCNQLKMCDRNPKRSHRPLRGKYFALEIENRDKMQKLKRDLKSLGAAKVYEFLPVGAKDKVDAFITDSVVENGALGGGKERKKRLDDWFGSSRPASTEPPSTSRRKTDSPVMVDSGMGGSNRSAAAQRVPTARQGATKITSRFDALKRVGGASTSRVANGTCVRRRTLPAAVRDAIERGILVVAMVSFMKNLRHMRSRHGVQSLRHNKTASTNQTTANAPQKLERPTTLQPPYVKIQDVENRYRPVYEQLPKDGWNRICLEPGTSKSIFHKPSLESKAESRHRHPFLSKRQQGNQLVASDYQFKGYCEVCRCDYSNYVQFLLVKHIETTDHNRNVDRQGFFDDIDTVLDSCRGHLDESRYLLEKNSHKQHFTRS